MQGPRVGDTDPNPQDGKEDRELGNKEDRSSNWNQEVLYKLVNYANKSMKKYSILCIICIG